MFSCVIKVSSDKDGKIHDSIKFYSNQMKIDIIKGSVYFICNMNKSPFSTLYIHREKISILYHDSDNCDRVFVQKNNEDSGKALSADIFFRAMMVIKNTSPFVASVVHEPIKLVSECFGLNTEDAIFLISKMIES